MNELEGEELAFYSLCSKVVDPAATPMSKIRHLHRYSDARLDQLY
jgi:hypothetical protein